MWSFFLLVSYWLVDPLRKSTFQLKVPFLCADSLGRGQFSFNILSLCFLQLCTFHIFFSLWLLLLHMCLKILHKHFINFITFKLSTENYLIWKEQLQSTTEGQGIDSQIFDESAYMPSDDNKLNMSYISWKKNGKVSLRAGFEGHLLKKAYTLLAGYDC